jgi:hypothetical protein
MLRRIGIAALLLCTAPGCGEPPLPRITALVPERAPVGATLDVIGVGFLDGGFDAPAGERFVTVAGVEAVARIWEPLRVRLIVPELPVGAALVVVTVAGRPSEAAVLHVEPAAR